MEFKKYKQEDMFYCYSLPLFHFLKANGFYYLLKEKNPNSEKYYWVFERTEEFLKALTYYSNNKTVK